MARLHWVAATPSRRQITRRAMFTGQLDWGRNDTPDLFTGYESQTIGDEHLNGWMNGIAIWY